MNGDSLPFACLFCGIQYGTLVMEVAILLCYHGSNNNHDTVHWFYDVLPTPFGSGMVVRIRGHGQL